METLNKKEMRGGEEERSPRSQRLFHFPPAVFQLRMKAILLLSSSQSVHPRKKGRKKNLLHAVFFLLHTLGTLLLRCVATADVFLLGKNSILA